MPNEHLLVKLGWKYFDAPKKDFVKDANANALLNDLDHFPHAFVLGCCMDSRPSKAEQTWMIPWRVREQLGGFDIELLAAYPLEKYVTLFAKNKLHGYYNKKAKVFLCAVKWIKYKYGGDASRIWSGTPSSATVVRRFLEFDGVGVKIATMAANILARRFKIPFADHYSIDVSPDVHVKRVMERMGLVQKNPDNNTVIYKARELCPEFPGIIDLPLWKIGQEYCKASTPECMGCPVRVECRTGRGQ